MHLGSVAELDRSQRGYERKKQLRGFIEALFVERLGSSYSRSSIFNESLVVKVCLESQFNLEIANLHRSTSREATSHPPTYPSQILHWRRVLGSLSSTCDRSRCKAQILSKRPLPCKRCQYSDQTPS
jgi:hypothetical protein